MLQQGGIVYNREGLDLLTGAPSQRSIRIWINNLNEPRNVLVAGSAANGIASSSSLTLTAATSTGDINKQRPLLNFRNQQQLSLRNSLYGNHKVHEDKNGEHFNTNKPSMTKTTSISLFDPRSQSRRELSLSNLLLKNVGCTSNGEIFTLLEDGRVGIVSTTNTSGSAYTSIQKSLHSNSGSTTEASSLFGNVLVSLKRLHDEDNKLTEEETIPGFIGLLELESINSFEMPGVETWFFGSPNFRGLLPIESLVCGDDHVCCVTDVGTGSKLFAWGNNSHGQCGQIPGKGKQRIQTPTLVSAITGPVLSLGCGPQYTTCITSNDTVITLYSWGAGGGSSRFSGLFKSKNLGEGAVPHADTVIAESTNQITPLIYLIPGGTSGLDMDVDSRNRPFRFWTESLSTWLAKVDEKWVEHASIPLCRLDSAVGEDEESFDLRVELENARSRLRRMQNALDFDVSRCALFPPSEFFEDPAPFEIKKALTNISFELANNREKTNLMKDQTGFEDDVVFLQEELERILDSKNVYDRLDKMWNDDDELDHITRVVEQNDREVLYALLEDCRRSELGYLAREQDFENGRKHNIRGRSVLNNNASLLSLIQLSETTLDDVKRGLDEIQCKSKDLMTLRDTVYQLYRKKRERNQELKGKLTRISMSIGARTLKLRDKLLQDNPSRYDISAEF
jgi:hypothetical protein